MLSFDRCVMRERIRAAGPSDCTTPPASCRLDCDGIHRPPEEDFACIATTSSITPLLKTAWNSFAIRSSRRLSGELAEDAFKPLRLMNGVYLQLHAYMLRVAIPYGTLNARQMRMLAHIARKYDRGYGHFTTRQNIQYNWPRLNDTPDILA
jgi:sulfite reductase beta subunit-like hemoprotein